MKTTTDKPVRHPFRNVGVAIAVAAAATAAGLYGAARETDNDTREAAIAMTGGDPDAGRRAIYAYGCGACHTIPGVHGADGLVGPSLKQIGDRVYVAGVLQNTPNNLVRWVMDAPSVDPSTAMPNLHVTEREARDVACYLYTLRAR
jgi:mono/diheme cytochrome c family protein